MLCRSYKKWLLLMLGVGVSGLAGGVIYLKSQQPSSWQLLNVEVPDLNKLARSTSHADRDRAKSLNQDYDAMFAQVLARNPDLAPEWKTVSDEENGFLQWLEFCEKRSPDGNIFKLRLTIQKELSAMIHGRDEWDTEVVKKQLEEHASLLDEVTRIGMISDQSTSGISVDRWARLQANFTKKCTDLLCADARVAAEEGDAARAQLRMKAALGLAKHHSQLETPSLITDSIVHVIQFSVLDILTEHVIPMLDLSSGEISQWRNTIQPKTNEDFAEVMRGEFYATVRGILIPIFLTDTSIIDAKIPDPEALCDTFAQRCLHQMQQIRSATPQNLYQNTSGLDEMFTPTRPLSEEAQAVYDDTCFGLHIYGRGWARAQAIYRYHDAALAIAAGEAPPADLLTGKPFRFDSETRQLSFPDDPMLKELKARTVRVPQVH